MLVQREVAGQRFLEVAVFVREVAAARADAPVGLTGRLAEIGAAFAGAIAGIDVVIVGIDRGILGIGQVLAVAEFLGVEHAVRTALVRRRFGRRLALRIVGAFQQRI